jgi:hypothetical protein
MFCLFVCLFVCVFVCARATFSPAISMTGRQSTASAPLHRDHGGDLQTDIKSRISFPFSSGLMTLSFTRCDASFAAHIPNVWFFPTKESP